MYVESGSCDSLFKCWILQSPFMNRVHSQHSLTASSAVFAEAGSAKCVLSLQSNISRPSLYQQEQFLLQLIYIHWLHPQNLFLKQPRSNVYLYYYSKSLLKCCINMNSLHCLVYYTHWLSRKELLMQLKSYQNMVAETETWIYHAPYQIRLAPSL